MPSIRWGLGTGADLCVPFAGNVSMSGCRLIGAGGADDDVALAWNEHAVDAAAIAHILGNEGSGNALDAVNDHDIIPGSWSVIGTGWLGNYAIQNSWTAASAIPQLDITRDFTLDFWIYRDVQAPADARQMHFLNAGSDSATLKVEEYTPIDGDSRVRRWLQEKTSEKVSQIMIVPTFTAGAWHHISFERYASHIYLGIDGQFVGGFNSVDHLDTNAAMTIWNAPISSGQLRRWNDIYLTQAAIHGGASFVAARYKSAAQNSGAQPNVSCAYAGLTGVVPSEVSWSATEGDEYGRVKRVLVNDVSAGWVQVGGDYPTSPVSVSGLVLPSADAVRVELEPEQVSGIQNETPVLDWVQLEYTAASTGRPWLPVLMQSGRYA